jgi:DNA replication regulator SLD3
MPTCKLPPEPYFRTSDPSISRLSITQRYRNLNLLLVGQLLTAVQGSLAYFAKGPLSRARAAFHLDCDANLNMNDLVEFLKSLTMSTMQIDKKFRETMPELVKDIKLLAESCAEDEPRKKRRKPPKMKIGKDGLYPGEVDHVKRWWRTHQFLVSDGDEAATHLQEVKYHITCLRTRETQLQMILILEILALEALCPAQDARDSELPGLPVGETPKKTAEPSAKKRHKHNYSTLLDIHADRLCIWQSTTLDEMQMIAAESQVKGGSETQNSARPNSDPLKDFCVDILLPL